MDNRPIGILDSGVGGLSVWKALVSLLPQESTIYIGDSLHTPYGNKLTDEIFTLSKKLILFLLQKNVKIIVVACNAITVSCLQVLQETFPQIQIIGMVPVIQLALFLSHTNTVGILATTRTASSEYYKDIIRNYAHKSIIINVGTDELVPLIERGDIDSKEFYRVLRKVLEPFLHTDIDTLGLACTHYPFIKIQIKKILGEQIQVVDTSEAVIQHTMRLLTDNTALRRKSDPSYEFYTTGNSEKITVLTKKLLGRPFSDKIHVVNTAIV